MEIYSAFEVGLCRGEGMKKVSKNEFVFFNSATMKWVKGADGKFFVVEKDPTLDAWIKLKHIGSGNFERTEERVKL